MSGVEKKRSKKGAPPKREEGSIQKKEYKGKASSGSKQKTFKVNINDIKNVDKRKEMYNFVKRAKAKKKMTDRKARKAEREALGDAAPKPYIKSIDKMREPEPSIVDPNDEEIIEDETNDEFAKYFNGLPPKVAITTKEHSSNASKEFACNMQDLIPGLTYYRRRSFPLKKIIKFLKKQRIY